MYPRKSIFKSKVFKITLLFTLLILFSCEKSRPKFEYAGGKFSLAIYHAPSSFIARNISDVYSASVVYQVLEGLVSLNPSSLKPEPNLASKWETSEDGKSVTFTIKEDVYWHENDLTDSDRKLTVEDVVYSVELACRNELGQEPSSAYSGIYKDLLVGAEAFYNGETEHISGLVVDGNQITFNLLKSDICFVDKMANANASIVLKEAVEADREANLIGTGPFQFSYFQEIDENIEVLLVKNPRYHHMDENGNQLPYLDSLVFVVESKSLSQLSMFEENKIQLLEGLPPSRITSMLEGRIDDFNSTPPQLILKRKPILATQYYEFNMLYGPLKDTRVRKAINYAVNRQEIIQNILNNQAYSPADAGIVPPVVFSGYNAEEVRKFGYSFDPEKAKKLLAEAGYPDGEGFPPLNLTFDIGTIHSAVAEEFAKQMKKTLNITVNIDGLTFEDKLNNQKEAKGQITRTSWVADYNSPETFLMNFYGKSVPADSAKPSLINMTRFQNNQFDELFEKATSSNSVLDRYKYFVDAEKILMKDPPIIVLWYEETIKLTYSRVRNLKLNQMNYYQFRYVYLKDWTADEYRAMSPEK